MKKKKNLVARLPMEAVEILRHKGDIQSSEKGKKGYDRRKKIFRRERMTLD